MKLSTPFHVLFLAAGSGERFGSARPKQYESLCGLPVMRHALNIFLTHPALKSLHVIINPAHTSLYQAAVHDLNIPDPVSGGKDRKESSFNGLKHLCDLGIAAPDDPVLIHDAARPFLSHQDIDHLLEALHTHTSATLGKPIAETLRRANSAHILTDRIDRTHCWALQTPQAFRFGDLLAAHQALEHDRQFTDDCGVMEAAGHDTKVVRRSSSNIKITWPEDLVEAEKLIMSSYIPLVGQGFDVHAFSDTPTRYIRLGGIDVPHSRKLSAHSDGDVVLHALTDALLGAIGDGDIGLHFPPSDPQWKDKDSAVFLEKALELLQQKGGRLNNVDITMICESPKLTPVRDAMRHRLSTLLRLPESRVNLKATTTEKLGFTGREEGIACQAIVSVSLTPC